ncbi:MAG: hypothetical protein R3B95_14625 [Nitrospirales bacterium]|nr:hypothetical protein [Nitrospirales bacterium]
MQRRSIAHSTHLHPNRLYHHSTRTGYQLEQSGTMRIYHSHYRMNFRSNLGHLRNPRQLGYG